MWIFYIFFLFHKAEKYEVKRKHAKECEAKEKEREKEQYKKEGSFSFI